MKKEKQPKLKKVEVFLAGKIYIASKDFKFDASPVVVDEGKKGENFIFTGQHNLGFAYFDNVKDGRRVIIDVKEAFKIMREK